MPTFNRQMDGGRSVSGNAKTPRSRRGNQTAQVDTYWSGLSGGAMAIGGTGAALTTVGGVQYYWTSFLTTSALTVTSAGTFEFYSFGGGGGGSGGNGYNAFGGGGQGGGNGIITKNLSTGFYTITVGAGGFGATAPSNYASGAGSASYFANENVIGGTFGAGGAGGVNGANNNANGAAGTDVSFFIGNGTLFKGAGGGNASSGLGGSGIGGNGAAGVATAGSAAANTASGGGGSAGSGQPLLQCGNAGVGGSGIVYVRWRA